MATSDGSNFEANADDTPEYCQPISIDDGGGNENSKERMMEALESAIRRAFNEDEN